MGAPRQLLVNKGISLYNEINSIRIRHCNLRNKSKKLYTSILEMLGWRNPEIRNQTDGGLGYIKIYF